MLQAIDLNLELKFLVNIDIDFAIFTSIELLKLENLIYAHSKDISITSRYP